MHFFTTLLRRASSFLSPGRRKYLKGQNPLAVAATPLAAAIHEARQRYNTDAKPLPDDVKNGLKPFFSDAILKKARFAVGSVEITLPNFIGQEKKFQGDHYAVVVDDIIVFNQSPPAFKADPWWWGHEVTHIDQYTRWGVETFAFYYLRDFGNSIETEANNQGTKVFDAVSSSQAPGKLLYPYSNFYSVQRPFQFEEIIVARCSFSGDTTPRTYVLTSKGNILAVEPLSGKSIRIGEVKPPKFTNAAWTFSTAKVEYSVSATGDILFNDPLPGPSGKTIGYSQIPVGKVESLL